IRQRRHVVFPDSSGPISPTISPLFTVKLISVSTLLKKNFFSASLSEAIISVIPHHDLYALIFYLQIPFFLSISFLQKKNCLMKIHQAVFINLDDSEWDRTTDLFDVNEALSR